MVYYKLGAETLKGYLSEGARRWAEYGARSPAQRKIVILVGGIILFFLLLGGLAPTVGYDTGAVASHGKDWVGGLLGAKGTGAVDGSKA